MNLTYYNNYNKNSKNHNNGNGNINSRIKTTIMAITTVDAK